MEYYSIGDFASAIGKTVQTVRNWDNSGKLKPVHISEGGHRYYSQAQIDSFKTLTGSEYKNSVVCLCIASTLDSSTSLDNQINTLASYCTANKYSYKMVSCVSYDNRLESIFKVLKMVCDKVVSKVVITQRDIVDEHSLSLLEKVCDSFGARVLVVNEEVNTNG